MPAQIDHFGLLTPSVESLANLLERLTGYRREGPVVEDPYHQCRVLFLAADAGDKSRLELVEPLGGESPLAKAADRGGGIHHIGFRVASLLGLDAWCRAARFRKVMGPNPAPAFGPGREVAFVYAPGIGLIELIETEGATTLDNLADIDARPLMAAFLGRHR